MAAATSFKHVSPAGCAVATPLTDLERIAYEIPADKVLTPCALAYVRARNADPMSSFGDFAAVSEIVDEATAKVLKLRSVTASLRQVSSPRLSLFYLKEKG